MFTITMKLHSIMKFSQVWMLELFVMMLDSSYCVNAVVMMIVVRVICSIFVQRLVVWLFELTFH